jgi:hypothetical protein
VIEIPFQQILLLDQVHIFVATSNVIANIVHTFL